MSDIAVAITQPSQPANRPWRRWAAQVGGLLIAAVVGAVLKHLGTDVPLPPAPQPVVAPANQCDMILDYEGAAFHGGEAEHVVAAPLRWPTDTIPYYVDYSSAAAVRPAVSTDAVRASFRQAADWWQEGLAVNMPEVSDPAQALLLVRFGRLDGPMGILAQQFLPDGSRVPKEMLIDVEERWAAGPPVAGSVALASVVAHEWGHGLGLTHSPPGSGQLMQPTYSAGIPRPTPGDYARAVAELGYRPRASAPANPGGLISFNVQAKAEDMAAALVKAGWKVGK